VQNRPAVLVGKSVTVRSDGAEPSYFTDLHRQRVGSTGVVHAIVATRQTIKSFSFGFPNSTSTPTKLLPTPNATENARATCPACRDANLFAPADQAK